MERVARTPAKTRDGRSLNWSVVQLPSSLPRRCRNWQLPSLKQPLFSHSRSPLRACPGGICDLRPTKAMEPIYTGKNTNAAYQLNWTLALFGKGELPDPNTFLDELKDAVEVDGLRILSFNQRSENTLQFLISTRPESAPSEIVRSIGSIAVFDS